MIDGASRPVDPETPIALTMGEPGGIGPEITVKAWLAGNDAELPPFFVIADAEIYRKGFPDLPIAMINAPAEANGAFETALPVLDLGLTVTGQTGAADPANANAVVASIDRGVELVRGDKLLRSLPIRSRKRRSTRRVSNIRAILNTLRNSVAFRRMNR